ncbi:MAG: hypothetical protein R3F34_13810 [Planctomycetota bacterium]
MREELVRAGTDDAAIMFRLISAPPSNAVRTGADGTVTSIVPSVAQRAVMRRVRVE